MQLFNLFKNKLLKGYQINKTKKYFKIQYANKYKTCFQKTNF